MKGLLLGFIVGFSVSLSAQDVLVFEQKKIDLGDIVQHSGTGKLKIEVTNTGTEPVIIWRTSTGDGGTYAEYPRDPIAPGKKGIITFIYSTDNLGPRSRNLYVQYNYGGKEKTVSMDVKYQIILAETTVKASPNQLTTKRLAFNQVDTIQMTFTNTGAKPLHMFYPNYYSVNKEIMYVKLEIVDSMGKRQLFDYSMGCPPNDFIEATIILKNIYGGKRTIDHTIDFVYNSLDTVSIPLKINSIKMAPDSTQLSNGEVYHYTNGELARLDECMFDGKINISYYFEKGMCTKTIRYDTYSNQQTTSGYSGNKLVKKETAPLKTD